MNTLTLEKPGMDKPLISTRVKTLREKEGISQQELATRAGLSISVISQIEQGKKLDLRMSTVEALAEALQVDYAALMGEPGGKKPRRSRKQ
jgi:transcriptional regulator with XRE-family HTH domain